MSATSPGIGATDQNVADLIKAVTQETSARRRLSGFSLTTATKPEKFIAPFLGLYLGWAVVRVPEVFPSLAVPRLPMILMLAFIGLLGSTVPYSGWQRIWQVSLPLKCVTFLLALALVTVPIGIHMSGSLSFILDRYILAIVIFLSCLIFMRDRTAFRHAVVIYVLCTILVAAYSLVTYDPNPVLLDRWGDPVDASEVNINRLRVGVGESLDPNDWGAVLATTLPLAVWLSVGSIWRRLFWGAGALTLAAAVVPTASRGSMLGLIAGAIVLITLGATGWRRFLLLTFMIVGGLVFSMIATDGQLGRFFDIDTNDYNVAGNEGRLFFWKQGIVWMLKRPWGYGISNFGTYFGWLNGQDRAAHSMWVQYGMELGIAGLAAIVTLCHSLIKQIRANRRKALAVPHTPRTLAMSEATLAGHVLAMLAATFVTGSFLSNAYYPLTYMALGIAGAAMLGFPYHGAGADTDSPESASAPRTHSRGVALRQSYRRRMRPSR